MITSARSHTLSSLKWHWILSEYTYWKICVMYTRKARRWEKKQTAYHWFHNSILSIQCTAIPRHYGRCRQKSPDYSNKLETNSSGKNWYILRFYEPTVCSWKLLRMKKHSTDLLGFSKFKSLQEVSDIGWLSSTSKVLHPWENSTSLGDVGKSKES